MIGERVLVFGTGRYYQRFKQYLQGVQITAFLDNDVSKQETYLDGARIVSPREARTIEYTAVLLMGKAASAMRRQLLSYGIHAPMYTIHDLARQCRLYAGHAQGETAGLTSETILFLTDNLSLTGAPIVLGEAAAVLRKAGHDVAVISMADGKLKRILLGKGIRVIIDPLMEMARLSDLPWLLDGVTVFVNTVPLYFLLKDIPASCRVVWWIHEAAMFYASIDTMDCRQEDVSDRVSAYAVSQLAAHHFKTWFPQIPLRGILPYGIPDEGRNRPQDEHREQVVFSFVGVLDARKGVDILLAAILLLPRVIQQKCLFQLVGASSSAFGETILERANEMECVRIWGELGRQELHRVYRDTDVLLCPSIDDPLPTVATEAMMHGIPCIVSDGTGTAGFIRHGLNGFVCKAGSKQDLANCIQQMVECEKKRREMGKAARELYEQTFSISRFAHNLLCVLEEL